MGSLHDKPKEVLHSIAFEMLTNWFKDDRWGKTGRPFWIFTEVSQWWRGSGTTHEPANALYGRDLAAYIRDHGLGSVVETGEAFNRNSSNQLKLYVWTIDWAGFEKWVEANPLPPEAVREKLVRHIQATLNDYGEPLHRYWERVYHHHLGCWRRVRLSGASLTRRPSPSGAGRRS
jgi:hypothetical protein